jgi:ZIP family zinc transporter
MDSNLLFAFGLTIFAGLATGIGSLIALFYKKTNKKFLSLGLGFSAGVMIYVSMIEIFFKAQESLIGELGEAMGSWVTVIAFFGGMFLISAIDKFIPSPESPQEIEYVEKIIEKDKKSEVKDGKKLLRMGVLTAVAVAIHNFPEGFATLIAALKDPTLGVTIAIAIAIHNIPEGIAVSLPIYYATGSRKKAFLYSFFSGLMEPIGAIVGYLILAPFMNEVVFGIVFAAVGGIMVFISLDQLLPTAREYGGNRFAVFGSVFGMIVMAVSLLLLI